MDSVYATPLWQRERSRAVPVPRPWDRAPASTWYLIALGLAVCAGAFVMIEPAPVDIALMLLLAYGLAFDKLAFTRAHELPLVLLAAFLATNVISMIWVKDFGWANRYIEITFYLAATWFFFAGVTTRHGYSAARIIMNAYVVGGIAAVIPATLAYLQVLHFPSLMLYGRPKGFFKDPNVYGPYLVIMLLWAIFRLQSGPRAGVVRLYWISVSFLAGVGTFFSYSRAGWINCVLSLGAYFLIQLWAGKWTRRRLKSAALALSLVLLVGAAVAAVSTMDTQLKDMLQERLGYRGMHAYDNFRFYVQREAIQSAQDKPLGIGPGQSEMAFHYATHSMYLRTLAEYGVPGFLAFFALVGASLVRAVRLARSSLSPEWSGLFLVVAASIVGLLVNGIVIDTMHWRHLWLLLALPWAGHPSIWQPSRKPLS